MRYSDTGNGITADSIAFYHDHRHHLGDIVAAQVRFPGFDDPHDPYLMIVRDDAGNEIRLSGCTTGYHGEGPRAAAQILLDAGWSAVETAMLFDGRSVRLQLQRDPQVTDARSADDLRRSSRMQRTRIDAAGLQATHPERTASPVGATRRLER